VKWGVVSFPGSNGDADVLYVLYHVLGEGVRSLWYQGSDLGGVDCVVLPGGFSYGDYLRCGAIASLSPIMESIREFAAAGGLVLGIGNGFQILCEAGLLPGALLRNQSLLFLCGTVRVRVETTKTPFTCSCTAGEVLSMPVTCGEGRYGADAETLRVLEIEQRVVMRYVDRSGRATSEANPNGSMNNVAGITNEGRNVFGLIPHPEHAAEKLLGGEDGLRIFSSVIADRASSPRHGLP